MCRFSMELEAQSESESFIAQLCEDLKQALIGLRPVEIELSAESHTIKMQEAVAIGLIINEIGRAHV